MAQISKAIIDSNIRADIFNSLNIANIEGFHKINDRQFGCIVTDDNGEERYVRIGAIVAEQREDMTAREYMQAEIDKYEEAQEKKRKQAQARAEKAAKDAERRKKEYERKIREQAKAEAAKRKEELANAQLTFGF